MEEEKNELIEKSLPPQPESDRLDDSFTGTGTGFLEASFVNGFLTVGGDSCKLPPWWSKGRDNALRQLVVNNEYLSGILFNISTLLYNINYQVVAKDTTIGYHNSLAEQYNSVLQWSLHNSLEQFIKDLLELDNGAFLYIDGPTPPSEPLYGIPTGLKSIDAMLCTRTRNATYPVVYYDPNGGGKYPIHVSRIIFFSQSPSNDWRMNKVGFSSVSRLNMLATHLKDIGIYDLEKLGSLESNRILFASGASPRELEDAIKKSEVMSSNSGLQRRGKTVYMAVRDPSGKLQLIDLKSGESGQDKVSDIEVTLNMIALVLGVQPYMLYENNSSSTRSSARESIKLSNSKLLAWFYKRFVDELTIKFLPPSLMITRPGEDQDTDGTKSRIKLNNALARKNNLALGITNQTVERQSMLAAGEITQIQFEQLELADQRLPNGLHISTIFYDESFNSKYLDFGNINPLQFDSNNNDEMITLINEKLTAAITALNKSTSGNISRMLTRVIYALQWLENEYQELNIEEDIDVVEVDDNNDLLTDPMSEMQNLDNTQQNDIEDNTPQREQTEENSYSTKNEQHFDDWFGEAITGNDKVDIDWLDVTFTKVSERRFRQTVRELSRGLWSGEIIKSSFISQFVSSLSSLLFNHYVDTVVKIADVDIDPTQVTLLDDILERVDTYAAGYADFIVKNKKGTGKLNDVYKRADLWIATQTEVEELAKLDENIPAEQEYIWRYGNTVEHCSSCSEQEGRVRTKSEWNDIGIYPQSRSLECKGYRCQCTLQPVNT